MFAAALAAIGLGLSACGSEDGSATQEPPASSAPAETEETTESTPADSGDDASAPVDGDVTAPGTELAVGDRAVLPFEYTSEKSGTIAVTVTAIEKGTEADMAPFGEKAKGMTPYFIRMTVENVSGADLSYATLSLGGVLEGGGGTGVVLIGGLPGKCESEAAPAEFAAEGATFETCSLTASPSAPVTAAEFDEGDEYSDNPVVWAAA
ncbi:hypothetical protein [Actinophytocola gossypii]|uniref:hypothetical protein n=1 Tax=Actinophytocola gossypii TaxID=2812003 RepID=UPI0021A6A291|nr:hypothetical protein [Actinophytocola gossypii]